jgi:hypothetical protein
MTAIQMAGAGGLSKTGTISATRRSRPPKSINVALFKYPHRWEKFYADVPKISTILQGDPYLRFKHMYVNRDMCSHLGLLIFNLADVKVLL